MLGLGKCLLIMEKKHGESSSLSPSPGFIFNVNGTFPYAAFSRKAEEE